MTKLEELSEALADVVESAGQSVVRVDGRRRLSSSGIVWSGDGLIVAANHAVTRAENLTVGLPGGETVAAELVGFDPTTDVIVLRATAGSLQPATFVFPDDARVGEIVLAAGRPSSLEASLGVIRSKGGAWRTRAGGRIDAFLEADTVMYPGFSGGPLVNAAGATLGMLTSAFGGTSVAIPAPTLRRVVGALVEHGHIQRGFLGVAVQGVELPASLRQELGRESGLLVTGVEEGAPAEAGGVLVGDILVALDDHALEQPDDLLAALAERLPGSEADVRIARGGELQTVAVTIGSRPLREEEPERQRGRRRRGGGRRRVVIRREHREQ